MAAPGALLYRNHYVMVGGKRGQAHDRQLDGLAGIGAALSAATGIELLEPWTMQNGCALCTEDGLHQDVEITASGGQRIQFVSQALCSALPVACSSPAMCLMGADAGHVGWLERSVFGGET